jgi:hypothetical protein
MIDDQELKETMRKASIAIDSIRMREDSWRVRRLKSWSKVTVKMHPGICLLVQFFAFSIAASKSFVMIHWGLDLKLYLSCSDLTFAEGNGYVKFTRLPFGWRVKSDH